MNGFIKIVRYMALFLGLLPSLTSAANYGKFESYIPKNQKIIADVMTLSTSKAVQEITFRFQTALKEKPEWFKDYLSKAEKGKPVSQISKQPNRVSKNITGVGMDDKLRLYKKGGKTTFMTMEEALKPYNFKQLSEASQKAITMGKSATKVLMDIEAEMNQ